MHAQLLSWHCRPLDTTQAHCCCCVQAVDLSVLGAQAIAQVERARKTAAANLAAAMQHRPRLLLRAVLDAPKIAVPVPASDDGQGKQPFLSKQTHCMRCLGA